MKIKSTITAATLILLAGLTGCSGDDNDNRAAECREAFDKITADFKDAYAEGEYEADRKEFVEQCVADKDADPEVLLNQEGDGEVETDPLDDEILGESPPTEEPTEEPTEDLIVHSFGDAGGTLSNGLSVKVSKLRPYRPTESAAIGKGDKNFIAYTVTIVNNSGSIYDLNEYGASATTGERAAEQVYDDNMGGAPGTNVLPGKSIKFDQAWGVDKGSDFVLYVIPDYDINEQLVFTS